jgi:hypothetical protein
MKFRTLLTLTLLPVLGIIAALTLTVHTTAQGPPNVASASRGAFATASSTVNGNYPASAANNDDRTGQYWSTPAGGWNDGSQGVYASDWAQVNFKAARIIDEVDVYTLRNGYATKVADPTLTETFSTAPGSGQGIMDFDIQYKSGKGWKTVTCAGDGAVPCGRITDNNLVRRRVKFTPVKTEAVRVAVHKSVPSTNNNYSRIVELEAWGKVNVALAANGAVATASSTTSPSEGLGNYEPVSAINGDHQGIGTTASYADNTFWRDGTQNAYPDWLQVDFAGKRSIDEVHVYTLQDDYAHPVEPTDQMTFTQFGITNFEVQYWDSGQWWTIPGAAVTGNNKVWRKFEFPEVYTDKIRVLVNQALYGRSRIVELEAYSTSAGFNVAWQKTATQSSTAANGVALRAVDGNRNGNFFAGSVTHSDYQAQPWWQVDLGFSHDIDLIQLFNRTDCACPERLANFYVLVSDQPFASSDLTATLNQPGVSSYYTPGGAGPSMSIDIGRPGRYVRVQLAGTNYLSLAEVEVLGHERTNYAREGLPQPVTTVTTSSQYSTNYPSGAVIDGDRTGFNWGNGGYGSGWNDAAESQNIFSADNLTIDFGATKSVNEVRVFTLQDNYQSGTEPSPAQTFSTADNTGSGITYFEVLSSTDGVNWTRVPNGLVLSNNLVRRALTFSPTAMRYVRVAVRDAVTWTNIMNNYSRIVEVEAYEAQPAISVGDVTVTEPSTGTLEGNFTVTLSAPSTQQVSVSFAPAPNTAFFYGDFFMTNFGTVMFQPGETSKNVQFFVFSDTLVEGSENFYLNLSNPSNATLADAQAVCTINDATTQPTAPVVSIDDETVIEGNAGSTIAFFSVTLSNPSNHTVSIDYFTTDGTAISTPPLSADYQSASGTVTFQPGETSQVVTVPVLGDTAVESDETFNVNLWHPVNTTIADGQGVATITNDDAPGAGPAVSISDVSITEGNTGSTHAVFTVSLSTHSAQPVAVNYSAIDEGGVDHEEDFTSMSGQLIFFSGETSKTVEVPIIGDSEPEGDEIFAVNLSNAVNCSIADYQGLGTIVDDDAVGEDEAPALALPNNCIEIANGEQNVGLAHCAEASASSSRGSFKVQYINDGKVRLGKSGSLYWSDNEPGFNNADFNKDWVQLTFKHPDTHAGVLQKLAVVRLFFQQDIDNAKEPNAKLQSTAAMRQFDVYYKTSHTTLDSDSSTWTLLKNVQEIKDDGGNDLPGFVRVAMTFRDATDVAKIRVKFKKGGLDGNNYSRLVELEAWRTAPPHENDENLPDPGGLLADLDWAMQNYGGPAPHAKWEDRLDWDYSRWDTSSENWGMIAHAIALWKDAPKGNANATTAQKVTWWKTVLKCQLGAYCNASAPKIRYFKGSELFSSDYDAPVTLAVAAVHYWAARIQHDTELELLAKSYLRATFGAYALAAGSSYTQTLRVNTDAGQFIQPAQCQTGNGGVFFAGPFIAMAGMRSPATALCQDDRGPLFNRAIERSLASDQNKREAIEKRLVAAYIQNQWGSNEDVNVYGLSNSECGVDLAQTSATSKLWRHVNGITANESYILSNMLQWTSGSSTYYIRTIVPYHFLGWGGSSPVRMTVMEDNQNRNTAPTYAVRYEASNLFAEVLYPWIIERHRKGITYGYARLEPTASNPATVRASNIDADNDGETPGGIHGERVVTMSGVSAPQYHVVLSDSCRPRLLGQTCVP